MKKEQLLRKVADHRTRVSSLPEGVTPRELYSRQGGKNPYRPENQVWCIDFNIEGPPTLAFCTTTIWLTTGKAFLGPTGGRFLSARCRNRLRARLQPCRYSIDPARPENRRTGRAAAQSHWLRRRCGHYPPTCKDVLSLVRRAKRPHRSQLLPCRMCAGDHYQPRTTVGFGLE